jgi:NAD(P)-dependent dehydrogenase (short-subunit alcohol dehydrogenase family)
VRPIRAILTIRVNNRLVPFVRNRDLAASKGSIINISSMLSYLVEGQSNVVGYTASKTGVLGLTRALAHSFGAEGIRVNAISPGYHETDMTKPLWSKPASEAMVAKRTGTAAVGHDF